MSHSHLDGWQGGAHLTVRSTGDAPEAAEGQCMGCRVLWPEAGDLAQFPAQASVFLPVKWVRWSPPPT